MRGRVEKGRGERERREGGNGAKEESGKGKENK